MTTSLEKLNKKIIQCNQCSRLVKFRRKIAIEKRKQYINELYWGKPITGFGDPNAQLLMIGLAPAAHGGNRTGRVFTGDQSSEFLFRCLHASGFSNNSNSLYKNDGLILKNTYLTTALKCVPPDDKPTNLELKTCFHFFREENKHLKKINIILALGKIAFDSCLNFYKEDFLIQNKNYKFAHGCKYKLPDNRILIGSYHPSPRNVNTGRIDFKRMVSLFKEVKKIMKNFQND